MPRPSRWSDIVRAAAEEFREHGYEGATIESIGSRVGILKGSLYHYIANKKELLIAVTEEPAERLFEELRSLEEEGVPPVLRLRALFRIQLEIFAEHYPAAFVYIHERGRLPNDEAMRRRDQTYADAVERIIRDGVEQGHFTLSGSPRLASRFVIGVFNSMQYWFRPSEPSVPGQYDGLADELFSYTLGGLAGAGPIGALIQPAATPLDGATSASSAGGRDGRRRRRTEG